MSNNKTWVRLLLSTLREEGCTRSAALVLAIIADEATERAERRCTLSQSEIAARAGCDVRTVRRAQEQLVRLGLLRIQTEQGRPSSYQLTEAVELPAKNRTTEQQRKTRERQRAQQQREELLRAEEAAYLSVANRFKEDAV